MKMYEELAEEKAEKENRELRRQPRERDHAGEQRKKVERVRQREEEGKILQCNEGKWEFHFDEESVKGSIILDLHVSRHLDSSLIDLDIHPFYAVWRSTSVSGADGAAVSIAPPSKRRVDGVEVDASANVL